MNSIYPSKLSGSEQLLLEEVLESVRMSCPYANTYWPEQQLIKFSGRPDWSTVRNYLIKEGLLYTKENQSVYFLSEKGNNLLRQ